MPTPIKAIMSNPDLIDHREFRDMFRQQSPRTVGTHFPQTNHRHTANPRDNTGLQAGWGCSFRQLHHIQTKM
jgi:hypothetical protein